MAEIRLEEAIPGSIWYRDPVVHPSTEAFCCELNLSCVGNIRRNTADQPQTGPRLVMQCYVLVSGWWDEHFDKNDDLLNRGRLERSRGFCRWYHLVNYGWVHESNLFGFFRRVV